MIEKNFEYEVDKKNIIDMNSLPCAVYRCENDEYWTMRNISFDIENICGHCANDFINNKNLSYNSIIHMDDRFLVSETINRAIQMHHPWLIEYRIIHKSGSIVWVHERGKAIFDDNGNVQYLDGVILKIEDERLFTLRLSKDCIQTAKFLDLTFKSTMDGIFIFDKLGKLKMANQGFCNMTDWL